MNQKKILVIKHGSLGDIISATLVFKSLRDKFKNDKIHIITSSKYKNLLETTNLFDKIIIDNRNIILSFILVLKIVFYKYNIIIDLQNSQRTMLYGFFFRINKSTILNGTRISASLRYNYNKINPPHVVDGLANQVKLLNLNCDKKPYLQWLEFKYIFPNEITNKKYFIINPGCSKKNIRKRWDPIYFIVICDYLLTKNIKPVLIGSFDDQEIIKSITSKTKSPLNLLHKSPLNVIFALSKKAEGALSNDTGPAHLIAGTGCKIHLVLSNFSKVSKVVPKGNNVSYTQKQSINDIKPSEVILSLNKMLKI